MKLIILLVLTISLENISGSQLPSDLQSGDHWFNQKLNHFSKNKNVIWRQRYMVNSTFYQNGGPVFLIIAGEAEANPKWLKQGEAVHYARRLNALIIQIEHRYYGKSRPTKDLSVENIKFLTTKQALADYANFIKSKTKKVNSNGSVKWIGFGGSYAGNLVAWLRQKYPKHLYGAVSTSGGLLAKANLYEYLDSVRVTLGMNSKSCEIAVRKSIQQTEKLLKSKGGRKKMDTKLKLCDPIEDSIKNKLDLSNLFQSFSGNFAGVAQYNKDNSPAAKISINDVCKIMVDKTIGSEFDRMAKVNGLILDNSSEKCLDYKYDKQIQKFRNTSYESEVAQSGFHQYYYQICNELGYWQTSDSKKSIFGHRFPLKFFTKQCQDIFGPKFNGKNLSEGVKRTNRMYLGKKPNTTNVIYVNGSRDPFLRVQIDNSNNPKILTILIKGGAHGANYYEPRDSDSQQVKQARVKIFKFLKLLVQNTSCVNLYQKKNRAKQSRNICKEMLIRSILYSLR